MNPHLFSKTYSDRGGTEMGMINSSDDSIILESVGKKYCKSLKQSMRYGMRDIFRNALCLSSHSEALRADEFWAIQDISLRVRRGEIVGIIGSNGSGKSTLLKLLTGIFWPDRGVIRLRGNIVSFLE